MSYNNDVWIERLFGKLDRRAAELTFDPHLFDRIEYHGLDLDRIEETVRTGRIVAIKCEEPNKLCFELYFGKENLTYTAIARFHEHFIEVKTAWPRNGR